MVMKLSQEVDYLMDIFCRIRLVKVKDETAYLIFAESLHSGEENITWSFDGLVRDGSSTN